MIRFRPLSTPFAALLFLASLALSLFVPHLGFGAAAKEMPFGPGERLTYRAKWGVLPAGDSVIEVLPFETIAGVKSYHFVMKTNTNAQTDLVYKVRERQDSYTDEALSRTLRYTKKTTGEHPRDIVVTFDWKRMTATYASFNRPERPVAITPGTFDPLALFFVIRTHDLKPGKIIEIPVTDGKKFIVAKATVTGRETLAINGRSYDTYVVTPDIERLEKAFKKQSDPKLKIWFSADERRIPVKIQSRISVGSFVFELVSSRSR